MSSLIISTLCLAGAACSCKKNNDPDEPALSGGWTRASSPMITSEVQAVYDKATAGMVGVGYAPVAYLASQVVAGNNHLFLCKTSKVAPGAKEYYALVSFYEDLQGNVTISDVRLSEAEGIQNATLDGGWTASESPILTTDSIKALEKATKTLTGASYKPVALLGTQVVAGTNYLMLCEVAPVVPNATSDYMIVKVYADLSGNAEVSETWEFKQPKD